MIYLEYENDLELCDEFPVFRERAPSFGVHISPMLQSEFPFGKRCKFRGLTLRPEKTNEAGL
jgi:hypothetical protein